MSATARRIPPMSEAALLAAVRQIAGFRGWLIYHTHRSDRSEPGWPDVVLAHPRTRQLLAVELKSERGRLTPEQDRWLRVLTACGVDCRVWRPADLESGYIAAALTPNDLPPNGVTP